MRVVVTGGAGFVGSSVALALAARAEDFDVVALDNLYRRGSELNLPRLKAAGVTFAHADIRHPEDLARAGAFDAMVECSAEPSVLAAGDVLVPVNLVGAYNCFEAARRHGAHVIFLSTSRVYPVATIERLSYTEAATRLELDDEQPVAGASAQGISEAFPLAGARTMYGATKLAAEILLSEYDLPWTIDRFGVVAGPWQMGKVDQGVFTHWAMSHHFRRPLSYIGYGGSGKQVRDLLHIDDLVDLVQLQLLDPDHWRGRTDNVGGGRAGSLSLLETTAICQELTGNVVPMTHVAENRPGDVPCYLTDATQLYGHTDWRPRRDPRKILTDTVQWLVEHDQVVSASL
jgi:CDP-paratose 2-epimerase